MLELRPAAVRRILCLGSHADDIEIGCGGTLLKLLAEHPGAEVDWVVFSAHGERAAEARRSAQAFLSGAARAHVDVHAFRDTYFPQAWGEIKEVFTALRDRVNPDLVLTHRREDLHQDHRVVAELTWCLFRDHLVLEYDIPKFEGDLGMPNVYVPLSEELCRRKIDAVLEHFPSQRTKRWFTEDTYWALLRIRGVECNSPTHFAEGLYARKIRLSAS
jgi:LmbE family N-acetylglucosaminyl deacetylase